MGKDNKKKDAKADMRWRTGMLNSKEREAMERYGLSTSNYGWDKSDNPGRYSGGDYDDMRQDFLRAASNDYDTRRGIEAMAMSGNEKAENIAKSGMSTVQNVMLANKLQKKEHKKAGNGGNFSSASDFAGTSYRSVQADRNNFIKDNDAKYASKADLANMAPAEDPDKGFTDPKDLEVSPELSEAKERASRFEAGMGAYGGDDEQDATAVTPASTEPGKASSMLDAFKQKLKKDRNFKHSF